MASDYELLRQDLEAEVREPGAVTKPELRDLLRRHPATPAEADVFDPSVFDPHVFD